MHKYFIYAILGITGFGTLSLAQFVDEMLSIDLAPSPQSGYVLSTDGTNNTWIVNTGGGGGSDVNWTYDTTNNVLYSDGSSTTPTTTVRSLTFTASSTSANSVFPWFTSTQATITNATSTTGWFSSIVRALNAVFTNATTTNIQTTQLGVGSDYITDITGTGLSVVGGALTATGDGVSNWTYNGSRLSPSTTVGIGVFASSTIGDGAFGGLTVSGPATTTGLLNVGGYGNTLQAAITSPSAFLNASTSGRSGMILQNYGTGTAPEYRFIVGDPYATSEYIAFGLTNSGATGGGAFNGLQKNDIVYMVGNSGRDMYIGNGAGTENLYISSSNIAARPLFKMDGATQRIGINIATTTTPTSTLTVNGDIYYANSIATGTATTTNLVASTGVNLFGGGMKTTANDLCIQITGNAGLCDGSDAGGSGTVSTSTTLADTYVTYATAANTIGTMFNTPHDAFRWVSDGTYRTALVGTSSASNAKLEINNTNTTSTRGNLRIISDSSQGADYDIRLDSPDSDIEFCDATTAPNGCFELNSVMANNQLYLSPRNGANTSFADPLQTWHRDSSSGAGSIGIGTRYDTPEAKLEIAASSTDTNILALTSAQGATVGDRAVWKRVTGFMGLGEATPNVMLHIATTSGSATHNFITLENTGAFAEGGAGMLFQNSTGVIDMARLYARPGTSYTDPSFRIQVADSGKTLRDRFVIDLNGMASTTALRTASSTIDNATTTNLAVSTQFNFLGTVITNVATWFDTVLESMSNVVAAAASVWDFGGAASVEIPNGASPTVDATGEIAYDTTSGQLKVYSGSTATVMGNGTTTASFTYSTSTTWTGTTTMALGAAPWAETWQSVRCYTGAGNVNVDFGDGTNWTNATTTGANNPAPNHFFTTNNTFTAGEQRFVRMGTPVTSPTYVSCTVYRSITGN